jgi:Icc protein
MRIKLIESVPFHWIDYHALDDVKQVRSYVLPMYYAQVESLPADVDAILVASDLQGRENRSCDPGGGNRLLGEMLADEIICLSGDDRFPNVERLGVVLAGDLYTRPELDRRGGHGDVRSVWAAFSSICRWVVGVAGNHDSFDEKPNARTSDKFKKGAGVNFLDGGTVELDGIRFAGLSGVIGNPNRPFRRTSEDFIGTIRDLLSEKPEVLILHEGPDVPDEGLPGNSDVRMAVSHPWAPLVICGHKAWDRPLVSLPNAVQILNVCSRCVVITRGVPEVEEFR